MNTAGTHWTELQTAGLVGVDRQPWRPPQADDPLALALARLPAEASARAWLNGVGLASVYRLAGQRPASLPPISPRPCPADAAPVCPPAAALRLAQVVSGRFAPALPEWLAIVAERGWRVPPEALPALLRAGNAQQGLRPAIRAVIGRRGEWLGAEYDKGDYAALPAGLDGAPDMLAAAQPVWETGTRRQRLALLEWVRGRSPETALTLLSGTWAQEKADDRAAFVSLLENQLSLADEEFLENALDDHSKEVWRAAAGLLARLPDSKLCQRMAARAAPLIRLIRPKGRRVPLFDSKAMLEVTPPEACDDTLIHDGLTASPPKGIGERAWWLQQMMAATPLETWTQQLSATPEQLVLLAGDSEWSSALLAGWSTAAARQGNVAWALALLRSQLEDPDELPPIVLWQALPPAEQETFALEYLQAHPGQLAGPPQRWLLEAYKRPWELPLSQAVLEQMLKFMRGMQGFGARPQDVRWLMDFAWRLHPGLLDSGPKRLIDLAEHAPQWAPFVLEALDVWLFRADMLKELNP